ncbi:hypothetical protein [Salinimonas chungwhensis]|uniref:hypothetical protein n=1 Tax=Salinimonas chungwhensis TaxID=265425 RepID=UPI00035DB806|nr:hypothetical protein [Salinimonas chungwhensis]
MNSSMEKHQFDDNVRFAQISFCLWFICGLTLYLTELLQVGKAELGAILGLFVIGAFICASCAGRELKYRGRMAPKLNLRRSSSRFFIFSVVMTPVMFLSFGLWTFDFLQLLGNYTLSVLLYPLLRYGVACILDEI